MPSASLTADVDADVDESPALELLAARGGRLALWAFAFWTILGLFFASQMVLLGRGITWHIALGYAMPQWYVWGLLTPLIAASDRRLLVGWPLRARLAWHLPLGLVWTGVALTMRLFVRPLIGIAWPPSIAVWVVEMLPWDLVIYGVIAGVSIARDYAVKMREHERHVHQLTIEAVELQRHLAESRLHSLRSQLQPHFLFNALNTISSLTESDPKTARRLMEQLGQLLRVSLRHASTPLVTLAEELTFLDDYLAIESVRFEGRIAVSVHADDDTLEAVVPGFLLQPLVENAIRHGVGPRLSGGHITVTAARNGSNLCLRVRDDGVGLTPDWARRREAGVGLRNTAARLEQLYPRQHLFRVTPDASGGGVEVEIDLPWREDAAANVGCRSEHTGMTRVRVLVVDDEKPARERLRRLLEGDARVQLVACCAGGAEAVRMVQDGARVGEPVHLLFLDVQMPELDGFGVVSALVEQGDAGVLPAIVPAIVFVTAHDEYALRAFDARAIDYLLKPFSDERFEASLDRAIGHLRAGHAEAVMSQMHALLGTIGGRVREADGAVPVPLPLPQPQPPAVPDGRGGATLDRIVLKGTDRIRLLPVQQITWIEAAGVYVKLHMRDGAVHLHRSLLGQLDASLDTRRFVRVHRSAIVNIDVVDELRQDVHGDYTVVLKDRTEIRLGRSYRERLQSRLGQDL